MVLPKRSELSTLKLHSQISVPGGGNCWQAKSSPLFLFVNKVLLEHKCVHLVIQSHGCFQVTTSELNSYDRDSMACKI